MIEQSLILAPGGYWNKIKALCINLQTVSFRNLLDVSQHLVVVAYIIPIINVRLQLVASGMGYPRCSSLFSLLGCTAQLLPACLPTFFSWMQ
jgi:hypothetical protein